MKMQKVTVTVKTETTDIESVRALLIDMLNQLDSGEQKTTGLLCASDGDQVEWKTTYKNVEV